MWKRTRKYVNLHSCRWIIVQCLAIRRPTDPFWYFTLFGIIWYLVRVFHGIALLALRLGGSGIHFGRGRLSATYHHSSDALNVVMVVVMMMMKGHLTMCDSHHEICKHCPANVFMRVAEHSSSTHLGVFWPECLSLFSRAILSLIQWLIFSNICTPFHHLYLF